MIHFDPKTLASWKSRSVSHIRISITDTGCAGHKIIVEESLPDEGSHTIAQDGISFSFEERYTPLLEGSRITWTGKKWILSSDQIHTRCGCGSSFSVKSGNPLHDRIREIKLALKEKKEGIHS